MTQRERLFGASRRQVIEQPFENPHRGQLRGHSRGSERADPIVFGDVARHLASLRAERQPRLAHDLALSRQHLLDVHLVHARSRSRLFARRARSPTPRVVPRAQEHHLRAPSRRRPPVFPRARHRPRRRRHEVVEKLRAHRDSPLIPVLAAARPRAPSRARPRVRAPTDLAIDPSAALALAPRAAPRSSSRSASPRASPSVARPIVARAPVVGVRRRDPRAPTRRASTTRTVGRRRDVRPRLATRDVRPRVAKRDVRPRVAKRDVRPRVATPDA